MLTETCDKCGTLICMGGCYRGWTNRKTWSANTQLTNDEYCYKELLKCDSYVDVIDLYKDHFSGNTDMINFKEIFNSIKEKKK